MTTPNPSEPATVSGTLSPDRNWVWGGNGWEPAVSPDGKFRWDGSQWSPTDPSFVPPPPYQGPAPTADELDDHRQFAVGALPESAAQLPGEAIFEVAGFAIGSGWVARRPVAKWHVMGTNTLRSVALVPPTNFTEWMYSRALVAPYPDVALQDQSDCSMRIGVNKFTAVAGQALAGQIPPNCLVTNAAGVFLTAGTLPGNWGSRFKNAWRFWPYH